MNSAPIFPLLATLVALCPPVFAEDLVKPRIEVFKAKRVMQLFDGDKLVKTWRVGLGENPVPPKEREGDRATPEGTYFICNKNPQSKFHLSLGISYPGPQDARRGLAAKLITKAQHQAILDAHAAGRTPPWNTKLGGEVFVHGSGSSSDWTWGCIALDNPDMDELYKLTRVKTPITIHP